MEDRTSFVPDHRGPNILPCLPLFSRLLRLAHRDPCRIAIRDVNLGCEKTLLQTLTDTLALRETLANSVCPSVLQAIERGEETYVAILAAGGYEFAVAILAVLALGAAAVPMTPLLPVQEAAYFIRKSNAVAVLTESTAIHLAKALESTIIQSNDSRFRSIPIKPSLFQAPNRDILVSSNRYPDGNSPGLVIFTSGTTGPPKASVMRLAYVYDGAMSVAEHYRLCESDVMLHILPVHHATGIGITFFPFLISGSMIEFKSSGADELWLWDRWRKGVRDPIHRLTFFSGVPTIYMRMKRYYQRNLLKLPQPELSEYVAGARQFHACLCGTSALARPINEFWLKLLQKRILQRYGATEFGAVFKVSMGDENVPDGSVGERVPGVDVRLSEGEHGEVLVKSPYMFSKYLNDNRATVEAHNQYGYYKTGDIARKVGDYYFIVGRASMDILKSGGYKISALDVEREMLGLPYIAEVMVVGVVDEEFGQRVAAAISIQEEEITDAFRKAYGNVNHVITIEDIRRDLRQRLVGYKLPTILRVIGGEFPKTASGKVLKKVLGPVFFPADYKDIADVQVWNHEVKSKL